MLTRVDANPNLYVILANRWWQTHLFDGRQQIYRHRRYFLNMLQKHPINSFTSTSFPAIQQL